MTIMIAKYERGKSLNVRTQPHPNAPVVRRMAKGDEAECLEVREGWAKLADGYANAAYLSIGLGDAVKAQPKEAAAEEAAPELEEPTQPEEQPTPEAADDDEAAELRKMTNPQLYDLAEQSGIKVKKGASKAELIAAILADE